jgi:hypothetical protein
MTYKEAVDKTLAQYGVTAEALHFQKNGRQLTKQETDFVMEFLGMFLADVNFLVETNQSEKEKT